METVIFIIIGIVVLALAILFLSRVGRFIAHNEQRAYVEQVLRAVEARGMVDMEERAWYS